MPESYKTQAAKPEFWVEQIKQSVAVRDASGGSQWADLYNAYRGTEFKGTLFYNLIFAFGRAMVPEVYLRNPKIVVTPRGNNVTMLHALALEKVLNTYLDVLDMQGASRACTLDTFIYGRSFMKLGFDSEFGAIEGESTHVTEKKSGEFVNLEPRREVKPGSPWIMRTAPHDVFLPKNYNDPRAVPWFIHRYRRPLMDIQDDPKMENTKNLKPDDVTGGDLTEDAVGEAMDTSPADGEMPDEWQMCTLYEIHDQRTGKVAVLSLNLGDESKGGWVSPWQIDTIGEALQGLPFETMAWNDDGNRLWPTSDAAQIWPHQREINECIRQLQGHRQVAIVKALIDGSLSPEAKAALASGEIKAFAEVDGGGDLRNKVMFTQSGIPQELIGYIAQILQHVRDTLGISQNPMGNFQGKTHISSAETQQVAGGHAIRMSERRDQALTLCHRVAQKLARLVFKLVNEEQTLALGGPDLAPIITTFRGNDLAGDYLFEVVPQDAARMTAEQRMQYGIQALQAFSAVPGVDSFRLMRTVVGLMPGISIADIMPAGPNPENPEAARGATQATLGPKGGITLPEGQSLPAALGGG